MKKHELQYQIRSNELRDTNNANNWLTANGWDTRIFATTHVRLLQAQQQARTLLTQHSNLLTEQQRRTLQDFQHKIQSQNIRCKLKPNAANAVLNISSKINRQLFKQHRHHTNK